VSTDVMTLHELLVCCALEVASLSQNDSGFLLVRRQPSLQPQP